MLPTAWPDWSPDELRAVLAHELAHVVRRDFLWRLITALASAIHFYHPGVHLLLRRLTLMQELAADRLAAEAVADRSVYLKALSRLALRQDDRLTLRSEPAILPVFSGFLIRRIEMLRSKDGPYKKSTPYVRHVSFLGLLMLVGALTVAMRGVAQQPEKQPGTRVARRLPKTPADANFFQRPPLDLAGLGDRDRGLMTLRVSELLKNDVFKTVAEHLGQSICQNWRIAFDSEAPEEIHFDWIDTIVAEHQLRVGPSGHSESPNQLQCSLDAVVVKFNQDVDWQQWIARFIPEAERHQVGYGGHYRFPVFPRLGPGRPYVFARDARTVCVVLNKQRFDELCATGERASDSQSSESSPQVAGGIFALTTTDRDIHPVTTDQTSESIVALHQLLTSADRFAIAADFGPSFDHFALQIRLGCADVGAAKRVEAAIEVLMSTANTDIARTAESTNRSSQDGFAMRHVFASVFAKSTVQTIENSDSTMDVVVSGAVPFPMEAVAPELLLSFTAHSTD